MTRLKLLLSRSCTNLFVLVVLALRPAAAGSPESTASLLRVGRAFHAFDHLGNIGDQAEVAAAAGVTIIYATGLGAMGYSGLPPEPELRRQETAVATYNHEARRHGIRLILGYVCATSIVGLGTFDAHWPASFRARFNSPPAEWLQVDRQGQPLPSWYGGEYRPACMNHPDWRAYARHMVEAQLSTGHDGIFFDNPTVHPKGCYCVHCMKWFTAHLRSRGIAVPDPSLAALRVLADRHPAEFLRCRATTARAFLAEMRRVARRKNGRALVTCNNSLNAPHVLFSQAQTYGYNILEKSRAEDLVVVEDMSHQPRTTPAGRSFEYGPTYRQLAAISRGKPIVAVTLAEADYHTPPNLTRLAMAEAAAHGASYLAWPTWPETQRARMTAAIRPQADFLRRHEPHLNDTRPRADLLLHLPFDHWVKTNRCLTSELAAELTAQNIQYRVVTDTDLIPALRQNLRSSNTPLRLLLNEPTEHLPHDLATAVRRFQAAGGTVLQANHRPGLVQQLPSLPRSVELTGSPHVRAIVHEQPGQTLLHLYNLDITRLSSFQDDVHPAVNLRVGIRLPARATRSVVLSTADDGVKSGPLPFTPERRGSETWIGFTLPRLEVNALLILDHGR